MIEGIFLGWLFWVNIFWVYKIYYYWLDSCVSGKSIIVNSKYWFYYKLEGLILKYNNDWLIDWGLFCILEFWLKILIDEW